MTENFDVSSAVIQAAYPSPQAVKGKNKEGYCVLGSALLFVGYSSKVLNRYPTPGHGAEALQKLNPRLGWTAAMSFSFDISTTSDAGMFQESWRLLGAALRYGRDDVG